MSAQPAPPVDDLPIVRAYREKFEKSAQLFERAQRSLAGGMSTELRAIRPFPVYIDRAKGSRKWSVEGHELVDLVCGHGSVLFGHGHPKIVEAASAQLAKSTHYGALSEIEIRWAELVCELMGTERVRFCSTGSEAVQLAMRVARGATGKSHILKFLGHYHGWIDTASKGWYPTARGVPDSHLANLLLTPPNDPAALERELASRDDIAAVIIEPCGGASGAVPSDRAFLHELRRITAARGVLLIFDEVVTGFRLAPGGAQEHFGVRADLVTLGKAISGGIPGGAAVAGRADLLEHLRVGLDGNHIHHGGTHNGSPVAAAAGVVALEMARDPAVQQQVNATAADLCRRLSAVLARRGVPGRVWGEIVHLRLGPWPCTGDLPKTPDEVVAMFASFYDPAHRLLRLAMLTHGVDMAPFSSWLSTEHRREDLERVEYSFDHAIEDLVRDGFLNY